MSPSDFGRDPEQLSSGLFLDHQGAPFVGHQPPLGIATLTYVVEARSVMSNPTNVKHSAGRRSGWMKLDAALWHDGGLDKAGPTRGLPVVDFALPRNSNGSDGQHLSAPEEVRSAPMGSRGLLGR